MREIEARLKISAIDRTQKAFQSVERNLRRVEQAASRASRVDMLDRHVRRVERVSSATSTAALGGARLMGGFALAGGGASSLRTLGSYEDQLIEIAKKGSLTTEQMHAVGEEARALATSGELALPLNEILSAYERGAAAGLPLDELREFAELSAKASDAFGMAAVDVGNAAAGFNVGLGIPISEMQTYFDLINSLADSGISDEADIITYLDKAGAALKNFGISAEDAAALGAAFLNLKLEPETAARMTNALTSKLIAPDNLGDEAYGVFADFVGNVEEFKDLLKDDAQGALRKFLGDLAKLDKFERARVTGKIFGMEWSDEIMRVVEGIEEVDRNIAQAANRSDWLGSLDRSYQTKLESLSSEWRLFQNQVGETVIDIGVQGLPQLKSSLQEARAFVKELGDQLGGFEAQVNMEEFDQAREAIGELSTTIAELLNINGEGSFLEETFGRLATAATTISQGINITKDAAQALGIAEQDEDTPDIRQERREEFTDSYLGWNPLAGGAVDAFDWIFNNGEWAKEREARAATGADEEVSDRIDDAYGVTSSDKGGRIDITPRIEGNLDSAPVVETETAVPTFRDSLGDVEAASGEIDASTDRLRAAMEASGYAITDSGTQAGASIELGAAALVPQGQAAGAAFSDAAGAGLSSDASAAGAAFGRAAAAAFNASIRLPNGQSVPLANRAPATTMPNAGTPRG